MYDKKNLPESGHGWIQCSCGSRSVMLGETINEDQSLLLGDWIRCLKCGEHQTRELPTPRKINVGGIAQ